MAGADETELHEVELAGGVGNAGRVVRAGDTVRRPWHPATPATHELLRHLARRAPGVAPVPLDGGGPGGRDQAGREVLSFVDGDVAGSPLPGWATSGEWLGSLGRLLRELHDALTGWVPTSTIWSDELRDPRGGTRLVHSDVTPGNVVTRGGRAVAIIDWEFAAPGRPVWDVVSTARACVPFTAPQRRDPAYRHLDEGQVLARLRLFLDAYGLPKKERAGLGEVLEERRRAGEAFVRGRVAAGDPAFVAKWATAEGERKLAAEREWVAGWGGPAMGRPRIS